jgi:hypothetical protein
MQSPERLHEKEYHFDEGMGQSLQEHVSELRERTPGLKVLTRRDRDGFAIVKTEWSPEFKYTLDMDMDLEQANENRMRTMEVLAKHLMPADGPSQDDIEQGVRMMTGQTDEASEKDAYDAMNYEFDAWTKLRLRELADSRMSGNLDDSDFVKAFTDVVEGHGYDYS